jgi:4-amino-4-deoxy-L-arabinose transferase-like glycosyltransferase
MTRRHVAIVSALALVLAAQAGWAVATTSGTYDETTYLRFGRGLYRALDGETLAGWGVAPLPVLLTSAAPMLAGSSSYPREITLARVTAIVLFGLPLVAVTYFTLLTALGPRAAIVGTALVSLSPNIVGHAALATTDVCFLVAALAALAALAHHLEKPSRRSRALLCGALALALAAKYSALALFVVVAIASFVMSAGGVKSSVRRAGDVLAFSAVLFGIALFFVWVLHAFAMAPFGLPPLETVRLPAVIVGIARQLHHQSLGEPAFLMGDRSSSGWWYYMPLALAMKSTPAELAVGAAALVALTSGWRSHTASGLVWRIAFILFAVLGIVNRTALGIRYVLILIPLSIFLAAEQWCRSRHNTRQTMVAAAVVALQLFSAASIAPHDLSYFNWFAGGPEEGYARLADSNIDWGQDLPALKGELTRLGARHPLLSYFGTAPPEAYGVVADRWDAQVKDKFERWDWVAISATNLDGVFLPTDPFCDFRTLAPAGRAGYSILLYPTSRADVRSAMATAAARLQ